MNANNQPSKEEMEKLRIENAMQMVVRMNRAEAEVKSLKAEVKRLKDALQQIIDMPTTSITVFNIQKHCNAVLSEQALEPTEEPPCQHEFVHRDDRRGGFVCSSDPPDPYYDNICRKCNKKYVKGEE